MSGAIDIALLELWREALLWLELPAGGLEVTPAPPREHQAEHFPPGHDVIFAVTAWNPGGSTLPREENLEREGELLSLLEEDAIENWAAAGYSPDLGWVERGVALPRLDTAGALELGARFGQLAIYAWRRDALRIVSCADGATLASYGWSARPRPKPPELPELPKPPELPPR